MVRTKVYVLALVAGLARMTRSFSEGESTGWMKEARAVADLGFHAGP